MKEFITKYRNSLFAVFLCMTIVIFVTGLPLDILAQSGPPVFPNDDPSQTPIDGGLGILAALGGTYAIKKLREKKDV